MKKIFLLNGGSKTREAFKQGLSKSEFISLKTKETILHIDHDLNIHFVNDGQPIDFQDSYVFTRLRASDAHFSGILYEHLRALGIPASDPINLSFKLSEEKTSQMARLARASIRIPETIVAREESFAKNRHYIEEHISFPLVYKTDGSQGKNVSLVNSMKELEQLIADKEPHALFILQENIPNTFDTRTLVAYGKILGTIKRTAPAGKFLNNVSQGGTVSTYELTAEEREIALKATAVCGLDFGGVDLIHTEDGPIMLEVNKAPQIHGFERVYGKDIVFSTIARLIEEKFGG